MTALARLLAIAALCLAACGAAHAQRSACTISSAPPMVFGNYNPLLFTDHLAQTQVNIRCTGGDYSIMLVRLGGGLHGTVGARAMRRNGVDLAYQLYTNSQRTNVWGDGTAGSSVNYWLAGPGINVTFQVYGRIPQRQNVPVGLYTDNVALQVDW